MTGRSSKKVGARFICATKAASQSSTGQSGMSTRATKERPLIRIVLLAGLDTGVRDSNESRIPLEHPTPTRCNRGDAFDE